MTTQTQEWLYGFAGKLYLAVACVAFSLPFVLVASYAVRSF